MIRLSVIAAATAFLFALPVAAELPVTLNTPANGTVLYHHEVDIAGVAPGAKRVAILVQGISRRQAWEVADMTTPEIDGVFRSRIELGELVYDGAYRIVAVAAHGAHSLRSLRPGMKLKQPPNSLKRSQLIRVTLAGTVRRGSADDRSTTRILLPVDESEVGPVETILVEGNCDPMPMVLIKPDQPNSSWYVQPSLRSAGAGRAAVKVRFGDSLTPAGEKFLVRVVRPATPQQGETLGKSRSIQTLPTAISTGDAIAVTFSPKKPPTLDLAKLLLESQTDHDGAVVRFTEPARGASVSRRVMVAGICEASSRVPILLVRSELDPSSWYIQPPCQRSGTAFRNKVYLGKLGTPRGTRFQILAVLVPEAQTEKWRAGNAVTEFPADLIISQTLQVSHNGNDQ